MDGGGRGIRTPGTLSGTTVFKTAGINHSPIPPRWGATVAIVYRMAAFDMDEEAAGLRHQVKARNALTPAPIRAVSSSGCRISNE